MQILTSIQKKQTNFTQVINKQFIVIFISIMYLLPAISLAKDEISKSEIQLEYPELNVNPLASRRIEIEMLDEKKSNGEKFYPFYASGTYTLLSGLYLQSKGVPGDISKEKQDNIKMAQMVSMSVGTFWVGLSYYLGNMYHPYEMAWKNISSLPSKNTAESLTRERLAEEQLMNARNLGRKLKWLSIASNMIASGMVAGSGDVAYASTIGAIGVVASLAPLVFTTEWERIGDQHLDYKKKIYGPLASLNSQVTVFPVNNNLVSGILISASF